MIKSFSTYITEAAKEVVFTFGRFNPPTNGHEKLLNKVASIASGNNYRIYASQSQDPKKNPLDFSTKIKIMRKMFPKHGRNIMADTGIRNVLDILVKLYSQGFTKVIMVVGSDRVNEFSALTNKYNGVEARHGMYNFEGGISIISAGDRDPDSDDVSGMSASKMRTAAAANDFTAFSQGLPSSFKDSKEVFDTLRKAMGIKEAAEYKNHVQLESVSDEREEYVKGNLYSVGDLVVIKSTEEIAEVTMLGSNYVLVETSEKRKLRKWISDIEKIKLIEVALPVADIVVEKVVTMPKPKRTMNFKEMFSEASGAETSLRDKARVNSFATGGETRTTGDADLWKQHQGK